MLGLLQGRGGSAPGGRTRFGAGGGVVIVGVSTLPGDCVGSDHRLVACGLGVVASR